jgi:hypothetical protein
VNIPQWQITDLGQNPLIEGRFDARSILDWLPIPSFDPVKVRFRLIPKGGLTDNYEVEPLFRIFP